MSTPLVVSKDVTLPASDLEWEAVRAQGPGGQNVNKVSSKVVLSFDFEGSVALTEPQRTRLRALSKNTLDAEGRIVMTSQKTRDQQRNLDDARDKLRELVKQALVVPKKRKPTKPSKAVKRRRVDDKKKVGAKKASRKKVAARD